MYKAASGAMEYMNIFEVSNINSTLKNLKDKKIFGFMALIVMVKRFYKYRMERK